MSRDTVRLKCIRCGKVSVRKKEYIKNMHNWKCKHCFKINPLSDIGVIWKTDTGTVKRDEIGNKKAKMKRMQEDG